MEDLGYLFLLDLDDLAALIHVQQFVLADSLLDAFEFLVDGLLLFADLLPTLLVHLADFVHLRDVAFELFDHPVYAG